MTAASRARPAMVRLTPIAGGEGIEFGWYPDFTAALQVAKLELEAQGRSLDDYHAHGIVQQFDAEDPKSLLIAGISIRRRLMTR